MLADVAITFAINFLSEPTDKKSMRAIGQLFTTKSRIDEPLEKQLVTKLQDSSVFLRYPSLYLSPSLPSLYALFVTLE